MGGNMVVLAAYFIMNIVGIFIMGVDKKRAKKHEYRISERTLWFVSILGGAVGTTIGMQLFRHKTKHLSFKIGFPLLAVGEIIIFLYFMTVPI
jgi:uncharacterized membrane protein YsdA (DUF1294 family)